MAGPQNPLWQSWNSRRPVVSAEGGRDGSAFADTVCACAPGWALVAGAQPAPGRHSFSFASCKPGSSSMWKRGSPTCSGLAEPGALTPTSYCRLLSNFAKAVAALPSAVLMA